MPSRNDLLVFSGRAKRPVAAGRLHSGIKLALLAVVFLVTASLVVYLLPDFHAADQTSSETSSAQKQDSDRMDRPVLTRTDSEGRLYTVSAASATRTGAESEEISLQEVRADAAFDSPFRKDDRLFLSAASAMLRGEEGRLELFAPVDITTSSHYRLQAEHIGVDLKQNRIEEGRIISIDGPGGTLEAKTMSTSADGNLLTFRGNVRFRWFPGAEIMLGPRSFDEEPS